jgi:hypothetical protein
MKNIETITIANGTISSKTILKTLVEQSVKNSSMMAQHNGSQIVNDVPAKLDVLVDENALGTIINGLLYAVVSNTKDSCIRISAKATYGNMIAVSVKDDNSCHTYAVACNLQEMVPLVAKIGGDINISNQHQNVTTISFKFPAASKETKSLAA